MLWRHSRFQAAISERKDEISNLLSTGDFQKAIDYIGDLNEFEKQFKLHIKIAKKFGPYKISVHSGSDKFSIYSIIGKYGDNLFHVKTAGTSYLEALRLIAVSAPALFKEIVKFSLEHFEHDRKSYHLTTVLSNIADIDTLSKLYSFKKKICKENYYDPYGLDTDMDCNACEHLDGEIFSEDGLNFLK